VEDTAPQSPSASEHPPSKDVAAAGKQSPRHPNIILDDSCRRSKLLFKSDTIPEDQVEMCPLEHPIEESVYSEDVGSPEKEEVKSKVNESTSSAVSGSNQPQPWELVTDPFVPIGIEQVCVNGVHVCVCVFISFHFLADI